MGANLDTGEGSRTSPLTKQGKLSTAEQEKKEKDDADNGNDEGDEDTVTEQSHTADHENTDTTPATTTTMVTCTVVELQAVLHTVVQKAVHKAEQRTKQALQRMQQALVQDMQQREQRLVQYIGTKVTALEQTQLFALDPTAAAAAVAAAAASTPGRHESNNAAGMMTSPVLAQPLAAAAAAAVAGGATVADLTGVGGISESTPPTFRRNWVVNYNALKDFVHKNGRYPLLNETKAKVGRDEANEIGEGVGEGHSDEDDGTKKKRKRGDTPADLGQWVINQRRVYHKTKEGTMTPQKLQQLEALPNWTWSKPRAGS